MTLPASGTITSTQIIAEMGLAPGSTITIPTDVRGLTEIPSGPIVWPTDFHGNNAIDNPGGFAGSSGPTITIPASAQTGDMAILYDMALSNSGTAPTSVVPSGWTSVSTLTGSNANGNGIRSIVSRRILTAGQAGSVVTGMNGSERDRKIMFVIRTAMPILGVTAVGWVSRLGGGTPSSIALSSSGGTPNMVVVAFAASENDVPSFSFGTVTDTNGASATRAAYRRYTKLDSPGNHTASAGDGGDTNGLAAGWFEFTH
jgi:hypothetical protein